ncbi:MAG: GNAT family N-acetyltransferase [Acidihalobacter sp.]|uniref:GNAT family N-acetyltransferase n=1 Tax=Acidihalobacter sp. TaxID=1872108 RepID=UPI00307F1DA6
MTPNTCAHWATPPDARLTPELFRRDGFGPTPAFHTLVAERDGVVIDYLLYHFGYDAELAARAMHIVDLYATRHHRGQGAGSALMTSARAICCADAIPRMVWSDYKPNRLRACSMNA